MITVEFASEFAIWQAAMNEKDAQTRPVFGYVQIHPSGLMMATDTNIAAVVPCTIEGAPIHWGGCLVPASFIKEVLKNTKASLAVFTITDEGEVIGLGKTGKFSAEVGQHTFPRMDMMLKSALKSAEESKGVSLVQFKMSLMDRLGQALGYDKGDFVPHQWTRADAPVLCYGAKDSGAVGVLAPACIDRAEQVAAHGRNAMQSIIARLSGEPCPVKKAE